MDISKISPSLSVSDQIQPSDLPIIKGMGFNVIINNRPDGEEDNQPKSAEIKKTADELGLTYIALPIVPQGMSDDDVKSFKQAMKKHTGPALAFCRTGTRSSTLWAMSQVGQLSTDAILSTVKKAGYDLDGLRPTLDGRSEGTEAAISQMGVHHYDVVVVGGGAGGLATVASLLKRESTLDIAVIEPRDTHYYQPGWTLVGGGVFSRDQTKRSMKSVMPAGVTWIKAAVAEFHPEDNIVTLEGGDPVHYRSLVVAPGLKLNWDAIEGLEDTLGKNGVTSNYRFDMAPYTWELVQSLKAGEKALFSQPAMPIKCAGAPQKAMYLACDYWKRKGIIDDIKVRFHPAAGVLFGVADYVPALSEYIDDYGIGIHYLENLVKVDGDKKIATFDVTDADGKVSVEKRPFDMLHVCPPQTPLDFMKNSPLGNAAGWVEVNNETLQHVRYGNIFGVGDGMSAPNAKTAAAVRKQAPVVAHNLLSVMRCGKTKAIYEGYGSCPLTVERGKVVLAEFGYGGALQPTFPSWLIKGTKATGLAWFLKEKLMPALYFNLMLKGREWLAKPEILSHDPLKHETLNALDFKDGS